MGFLAKSIFITTTGLGLVIACKAGKGPISPEEQAEFHDGGAGAISGDALPIESVDDTILGQGPGEVTSDSTQGNVPTGTNQQTPPASGAAGSGATPPTTPPAPPPPAFYPASCAEIKAAKPDAASGIFKIYLNPVLETRVALDASCDMTEDGGGWTLVLNYSHKANTNPPIAVLGAVTPTLPLLGADVLGTDESALVKNWGHAGNLMLSNFAVKELRYYCRSSQNVKVIHFKTTDAGCITAAQKGTGSCSANVPGFTRLTGNSGILPGASNKSLQNAGDLALTKDALVQDNPNANDVSWSIKANNDDAWECDAATNTFVDDTIHRVWFR